MTVEDPRKAMDMMHATAQTAMAPVHHDLGNALPAHVAICSQGGDAMVRAEIAMSVSSRDGRPG